MGKHESKSAQYAREMVNGPTLYEWEVTLKRGDDGRPNVIKIEAHYCFNNNDRGEGLVFRRRRSPEGKATLVGSYSPDVWESFRQVKAIPNSWDN